LHPKSDIGRTDDENSLYPSQKEPAGLRGQSDTDIKGANGHGPLNQSFLTDSENGGAASVTQQREIEKLIKQGFSEYAACVQVLAADHPLDCGCEVCG
jgi:hypothetical protein